MKGFIEFYKSSEIDREKMKGFINSINPSKSIEKK